MIEFRAAQALVVAACSPLGIEDVAIGAASTRVIAVDCIAHDDLVPFARSAMDGYAVASADVRAVPVSLPIAGAAYAGSGAHVHRRGTATKIATGAPVPAGADAVIPFEDVAIGPDRITVGEAVEPGDSVFPPGEDARRGDLLAARGTRLAPAQAALLAAAGYARVPVYRRPRVQIVCGGDELVAVEATPQFGQIRDSNTTLLRATLESAGAEVLEPLRIRDDAALVRATLATALEHADLIVTTGGASVGERDFVKRACAELGVTFAFETVALRPAKPTAFGSRGPARIAVLPGNPAAAFVALHAFVMPAVMALCGAADTLPPRLSARLRGSTHAKPGRHYAAFAGLELHGDGLVATLLDNQCSSLTRTAAVTAGFIIVPPGDEAYGEGDRVDVDLVDATRVVFGAYPAAGVRLAGAAGIR